MTALRSLFFFERSKGKRGKINDFAFGTTGWTFDNFSQDEFTIYIDKTITFRTDYLLIILCIIHIDIIIVEILLRQLADLDEYGINSHIQLNHILYAKTMVYPR